MTSLKRLLGSSMACCIILASLIFANAVEETKYVAQIDPVHASLSGLAANSTSQLELTIEPQNTQYEHGSSIDTKVSVKWDSENWDTTLDGIILVYNNNNDITLIGSACGYNGSSEIERNFIGIDFMYNINSGECIATASYNIGDPDETTVEFGNNGVIFNNAMNFLAETLEKESEKQERISEQSTEGEPIMPAIDDGLYTYFVQTDNNAAVTVKMWGARELLVSGSRVASASVKGNLNNAKRVILQEEPSAWAVAATNCNMRFGGSTEVRFSNSEMKTKSESQDISFSIPLPAGQSYTVSWTPSSIDTIMGNNDKTVEWQVWDVSGIDELLNTSSTSGAGFQDMFYCVPSSVPPGGSKNFTLAGRAYIGYHYLYIDSAGQMNNKTKYFEAAGSTTLRLVNPA